MDIVELQDEPVASDGTLAHAVEASVDVGQHAPGLAAVAPLGEWLALIAAREESAMGKLHHAVVARVWRVVSRIVPDSHLADEVVSECFWQVWREASRFDATRGSVTSWVSTIARSRALDAMRRRKALATHEEPLTEDLAQSLPSADDTPPTRLQTLQRDRGLNAALSRIDPIQRQLLSLAFVSGLSHEQVAEHCGLALGTVKSHIRRGLSQMRVQCTRAGLQP